MNGLAVPLHGDSSMLQESAQDSTLTLIESTSRSAIKGRKQHMMNAKNLYGNYESAEVNHFAMQDMIANGAKSMTSMPRPDSDEMVAERLKFKLK